MFLNHFSAQEKRGFLDLCLLAIRADQNVSEDEIQLLEELRHELGIPEDVYVLHIKGAPNFAKAVGTFKSKESKRRAYLELANLAFVDGEYDPEENRFMQAVQKAFGIDDVMRDRCFAWAIAMIRLREEALALMVE